MRKKKLTLNENKLKSIIRENIINEVSFVTAQQALNQAREYPSGVEKALNTVENYLEFFANKGNKRCLNFLNTINAIKEFVLGKRNQSKQFLNYKRKLAPGLEQSINDKRKAADGGTIDDYMKDYDLYLKYIHSLTPDERAYREEYFDPENYDYDED